MADFADRSPGKDDAGAGDLLLALLIASVAVRHRRMASAAIATVNSFMLLISTGNLAPSHHRASVTPPAFSPPAASPATGHQQIVNAYPNSQRLISR
ncbi:hypothetical protein ACVWWQ_003122 [Rhodanobacter sp. TND4EL1]